MKPAGCSARNRRRSSIVSAGPPTPSSRRCPARFLRQPSAVISPWALARSPMGVVLRVLGELDEHPVEA
ncbi:MAG: hypothetical protein ACK559_24875, partial [bacterium]